MAKRLCIGLQNVVIDILINHGVDINHANDKDETALHKAAYHGHQQIVQILLEKKADIIKAVSKDGWTSLHFAAAAGHIEVIKILLKYERDIIRAKDKDSKIALYLAAERKHIKTVKYLLEIEASIDKDFNNQYFNYIYFSAKKKYNIVVKLLLSEETDNNMILHHSAGKEDIEIIKFLLEHGANFDKIIDENDRTPLHWAAFVDDKEMVKYFIEKNSKLINAIDQSNETALYEAVVNGHIEIVEFLLDQNADINCINKNGWKPLHMAVISCQVDVFKLLKNKEVDDFQLKSFLNQLDNIQLNNYCKFKLYYSTKGLIKNFQNLEKQSKLKDNNDIDFISLYQNFLKLIENFAKYFSDEKDKYALSYLYTCILSKICNLKFELKSNLIIDINGYFKMIINHIELLKDEEMQHRTHEFKKEIRSKVEEAYKTVSNQIKNEIDNIVNEINKKIDLLLDETKKLIEKAEENELTLERRQRELKNKLVLRQTLGIVKIIGQTISVTGGPIGVAGDVIKGGVNIAEAFISENNNSAPDFKIPSDIRDSLNNMKKVVEDKEIKKKEIKIVEQQLIKLSNECDKYPDLLNNNIKKNLNKIQNSLSNIDSAKMVKEIKGELEQTQKKLEELKKKDENTTASQRTNAELEVIQNLNIAITNTEMVIELYDKYKKDKEELDALNISIEQAEDDIKKLKRYEENINNAIIPMLQRMQDGINNIENEIDQKSHVFLDLTKWQVQTSLKDIKYEIWQISKGFEIQDDVTHYMERLDEGITTLINIYDRIQDYYDQAKLASYIAYTYSPIITKIEDKELNIAINELKREIRTNIIFEHFKRATNAFKQWVFPFANKYSDVLHSLSDNNHIDINNIEHQIKELHLKVEECKTNSNDNDSSLIDTDFNSENKTSRPFFVWENKNYSQEISKLLNGDEITIKADIIKSDFNKNAIKFNEIGIRFKSINKTIQDNIDCELEYFDVEMVHLGNSYYRYGDKYYMIISDKQVITYSFEKKKDDRSKPLRANKVYNKIMEGELMLSPYTMWKIKLESTNNACFSELKKYDREVDLENNDFL
ncbi:Collagen alpha-5VI chain [Gigaspora margarita]|uniref:Collagen alpha-5VI chain n=1 Tax=Gigaspora margarita TaxID=4874 RepID=A0A8H4AE40_GIGMA|nr:Collagen alpha-5VI chain [Gigaspora margarita]